VGFTGETSGPGEFFQDVINHGFDFFNVVVFSPPSLSNSSCSMVSVTHSKCSLKTLNGKFQK
jgi:hypothetical protein